MRTIRWTLSVAALALAASATVRAEEGSDPKAIVEKAIKATGGAELLKKYPAVTLKGKGQFYGTGDAQEFTIEQWIQPPDRLRQDIKSEMFSFSQGMDGDKGWMSVGGNVMDMNKEMLEETRELLYAQELTHLLPLLQEGYKLTALPEIKVAGKPAAGIRVQHQGHRDTSLYFDKDSGLLVRVERRGKDPQAGQEFNVESIYENYKNVDGLQVPFKITVKRDGKRYVETEVEKFKPAEKLDEKVFQKPSGG